MWDISENVNDYDQIGYAKVLMAIKEIGTKSNRNYDTIIATFTVGANPDTNYHVENYSATIAATDAEIFQPKIPPSTSNSTVTNTYATSFSNNGTENTVEISISNNPNGQTFTYALDGSDMFHIYAEPASFEDGCAWSLLTGATVGASTGAMTLCSAYIKELKIKNFATYTLSDYTVGLTVWIKNHIDL